MIGWRGKRRRRPDDGRFLPKDAAAWRRLVDRARACARAPLAYGPGEALNRAGEACMRAVMPPGHRGRDSVFMRLALEARLFWTLKGEDARVQKAAVLAELAWACAAALPGGAGGTVVAKPPRFRADLDG